MATLAEAVDAAETDWLVSADIPDTVDFLTVQSEVVQVTATFPAQYQARDGSTSDPRIRVVRAAGGTTAASHADGTTLTPLIPPSASGGGAAEAGTVVVTPPLEVDVGAALEGANAPSGGNPLATIADLNVQVVSRHLTSAEILALFTTPIELVAGVPGQFHVPVFAVAVYKVGTTPYTLNQTTFLNVSAIPTTMIAIANTFFLDQADDTVTMIAGLPNGIAPALATVEGAALSIWIDTVNPTDGDGTVDLTLLYHTIDATP